jgi:hypothetical protein
MNPFERAQHNAKVFSSNLVMFSLLQTTIEETKDLSDELSDQIWLTILTMLEKTGKMGEAN